MTFFLPILYVDIFQPRCDNKKELDDFSPDLLSMELLNPIQDGPCGLLTGMGGQKAPSLLPLLIHPLNSADISIFSQETSKFCNIKKYTYRLHFDT